MRIADVDSEVAQAMQLELERQRNRLELIASENFVEEPILEAQGSVLTNKYAEGYPKKILWWLRIHWYGWISCNTESKRSFGAEGANVQPHSGTQANFAVYFATMKPGETLLGMDLSAGGHFKPWKPGKHNR